MTNARECDNITKTLRFETEILKCLVQEQWLGINCEVQ
jgi:hypothetical protein